MGALPPFDFEALALALIVLLALLRLQRISSRAFVERTTPTPPKAPAPAAPPPAPAQRKAERAASPAQAAAESELVRELDALPLTPAQRRFVSPATRLRFLRAHGYNVQKTLSRLRSTIEWRSSFLREGEAEAWAPHCALCERDPDAHSFFSIGRDRRGWEVLYCCPARSRTKSPEENVRHLCMVLEDAFDRGAATGRFVWMIDLHNMGLADLDPRVAHLTAPVLLQHHPGRLGQMCLLDAPPIFKALWRIISPLLDAPTAARVLPLTAADQPAYFAEHLTPNQQRFMTEVLRMRAAPGAYPSGFEEQMAARTPFRIDLDGHCCQPCHGAAGGQQQQQLAAPSPPAKLEQRAVAPNSPAAVWELGWEEEEESDEVLEVHHHSVWGGSLRVA